MQGGRHPFFNFGCPLGSFGGFPGFGGLGGFGGFEDPRSLMSSILGGHDPFDDPFFASPFGPMFGSAFSRSSGFAFPEIPRFIGHESSVPRRLRGPVIEELNSDDEESRKEGGDIPGHIGQEALPSRCSRGPIIEELSSDDEGRKEEEEKCANQNPRKHGRSVREPAVEGHNDESREKKKKYTPSLMNANHVHELQSQPFSHSFCFQSSTVSYGGANGAYYASRTRRTGSDGLMFEECKEADSSSREATHKVTRGIHDKGHSVTRKLSSSGHVDTTQTLHNLDGDDLVHFNKAWKANAGKHLPLYQDQGSRDISSQQHPHSVGWALPSTERSHISESRTTAPPTLHAKRNANHIARASGSQTGHAASRLQHQG